ncbi:protein FAM57B-like isoform X2 [Hippocampus comes]|uniref:protein FAM57B-like isoform X2 n=1 Tax=Hippocampus comes TaxID=109280 RepID=UPI00094E023C|nr:PREDICTED: protein FAM57B-like isoform X2 [Hippocampus comes]
MLTILAAGSVFFPGLFLLSKQCLKSIPALRWSEGDAVIVSARLVSSVQAVMASSAGYIIASSCDDIIEDQHWLTSTYIMFAVPYFVYDIYAMFMCYWYKLRVKGHEEASAAPQHMASALTSYLRREFLMVLHHVVMVTVCFPVSVYKQQHTLLHKVNGALMLITFFICRVLLFPYLYYVYGRYASIPFHLVPLSVPWHCNLGAALLMAPQLYWFSLICRGALRLFTGSSRSQRRRSTGAAAPQPANGYRAPSTEPDLATH